MPLPPMTPEQRADALAKAATARRDRKTAKDALAKGETTLTAVLDDRDSPLQGARVLEILRVLPGVGPVKAKRALEGARIPENRRVRGLRDGQRQALKDEFEPVSA